MRESEGLQREEHPASRDLPPGQKDATGLPAQGRGDKKKRDRGVPVAFKFTDDSRAGGPAAAEDDCL